jgi:hypothetical protein
MDDDLGFLIEGVKTYVIAPMPPLNSPNNTSIVYAYDKLIHGSEVRDIGRVNSNDLVSRIPQHTITHSDSHRRII